MKLKSGRELTQLEIIKRLNLMGIEYNSDIIGKNYYIDLYNKAIQSKDNLDKIKNSIEKDQQYFDFLTQNFGRRGQNSFKVDKVQSVQYINKYQKFNNNMSKNCDKEGFFDEFVNPFARRVLMTRIVYNVVDNNGPYINKIGNNYIPKLFIPFQATKKCTLNNIYPKLISKLISKLNELMDIMNYLISDNKFVIIGIMIFLILIIIIFLLFRKGAKKIKK